MATDGVNIIDGDLAHDTYHEIMNLYDSGVDIELIKKEVSFDEKDWGSDGQFYYEIFITAYALAFWEIGALTDEMLIEVKRVIEIGEGVKVWTDECDTKEGQKREKVLEKFLVKISLPKLKVRKRKKYKIISQLYFQADDLVTFQAPDGYYYAAVCAKVTQQRGKCTYDFVATTYKSTTKPKASDLAECFLAGRRVGCSSPEYALIHQPGADEIWRYCPDKGYFRFGLVYFLVNHRDMVALKSRLEVVGTLKIKESFKEMGSYGYESTFERFAKHCIDFDTQEKIFKFEKYPVTLLCE